MPTKRHRHFLVLPLFALSVALSTVLGSFHAHLLQDPVDSPVRTIGTARILPDADADLDFEAHPPVLLRGGVLFATDSIGHLRVFGRDLSIAGGAFYVSFHEEKVTIAALSAPVLVKEGAARTIIPIGQQWTMRSEKLPLLDDGITQWISARRSHPLPERFLREHLDRVTRLVSSSPSTIHTAELAWRSPLPFTIFTLPAARMRVQEDEDTNVVLRLRDHVLSDNVQGALQIIADPSTARVWKSPRIHDRIVSLLLSDKCSLSMMQVLFPLVSDGEDGLLLKLHPRLAPLAWTYTSLEPISDESLWLMIMAFPLVDTESEGNHTFAWQRWSDALVDAVKNRNDSVSTASAFLEFLGPLVELRERAGYPKRARLLADALLRLSGIGKGDLTPAAQEIASTLAQWDRVRLAPLASQPKPTLENDQTEEGDPVRNDARYDPSLVERSARALLSSAGAIFSLETRLIPLRSGTASVEAVVFGGSSTDRTASFTLQIDRREVSEITVDGVSYPLAMPWHTFVRWVQR